MFQFVLIIHFRIFSTSALFDQYHTQNQLASGDSTLKCPASLKTCINSGKENEILSFFNSEISLLSDVSFKYMGGWTNLEVSFSKDFWTFDSH